jgi:hypothetical protein
MKGKFLFLFVILLLALILGSFLGGRGYFEGMVNNSSNQTYYGPNGSTAQVSPDSNGSNSLVITYTDGTTATYSINNPASISTDSTYTGPNGSSAKFQTNADGSITVVVTHANGDVHTYTLNSSNASTNDSTNNSSSASSTNSTYDNYNHYKGTSLPNIFYGPNGGTARVIETSNNNTLVITNKNGTTEIYYINTDKSNSSVTSYYGPNGGSAKIITDSKGKQAVEITTQDGTKIVYYADNVYTYNNSQDDTINQYSADTNATGSDYNTAYDSSAYYSGSQGVTRAQIPPGQEDLYILKSQVIPPVCPKCPDQLLQCPNNSDTTKCPPCPPCSRCPEPAFDCKKVPNYNSFNQDFMPVPVLNSFSTFGM